MAAGVASAVSAAKHNKLKLREVNRHLVCRLCRGYYVDATTIAECLHSFCRSCIIKYLEKNSFCPICEVQIHKTKPYLNLRLDKALQDVVYKLVPGLYHNEMKRRREFYAKHQEQIPVTASEQCGLEERIIFSPEDSISLSLEYLESDDLEAETVSSQSSESGDGSQDGSLSFPQQLGLMKLKNNNNNSSSSNNNNNNSSNEGKNSRRESQDVQETQSSFQKRYLQCPAVVSVFHLKKFIRMKHDLTDRMQVDIIHKRVPLPDHYTLMDVAYIYTWKRSAPMRFFYQIYQTKRHKIRVPAVQCENEPLPPQIAKENVKQSKDAVDGKQVNGKTVEANKNAKADVKNDPIIPEVQVVSEVKPPVAATEKPASKTVDSKKSAESKKLESARKLETIVNGIKRDEKKMEQELEKKKTESSKSTKSDSKTDSVAVNANPKDNKVDSGKTETAKQGDNKGGSSREAKEKIVAKENERLLLNPVSGQLESVPSRTDTPPTTLAEETAAVNGMSNFEDDADETEESGRKRLTDEGSNPTELNGANIVRRSFVNSLKTFRKERPKDGAKSETKCNKGGGLTITTVSEKETEKILIEIKKERLSSEYDFDWESSPPSRIMPLQEYSKYSKVYKSLREESEEPKESTKNSWMSLQDFRMQMLKENNTTSEETVKKDRRKSVPSLYRINTEANKKSERKTPTSKAPSDKTKAKKVSPTIINIKTENEESGKTEINIEVPDEERNSPPRPIKIENRGGEYSIKQRDDSSSKKLNGSEVKSTGDSKKQEDGKSKSDGPKPKDLLKALLLRGAQEKSESEIPKKKSKTNVEELKNDQSGAIDLSKSETSPKSMKNPLENLIDLANKTGSGKSDENMVEALISVAQKQSIEPLLKIPHYSQNLKACQDSPPLTRNISSNDISQALQFFKDLRSDIKVLEAKSQMSPNSFLEQISQKSPNLEPIQLYQQHIDLIRRLKRQQQMAANDSETPQRKQPKLSPTSDQPKKKTSPDYNKSKVSSSSDESAQFKSSVERTLSQIHEQMEMQSRIVAAQNYKNLLQFYSRPGAFCPGPTSPSKSSQNRLKSSSHSPNSQKSPESRKSPQNLTSPSGSLSVGVSNADNSFFNSQYSHLINAGLNSEMTFHQMFQNYLMQQEKINKIKQSPSLSKKPGVPPPKSFNDLYFGAQTAAKKPEPSSVPTAQKT